MPTNKDVEDFVVECLKRRNPKARVATFDARTNLVSSSIIDSFGLLEVVAEIERRFTVKIDLAAHEFEVISTLGGLCDAVERA